MSEIGGWLEGPEVDSADRLLALVCPGATAEVLAATRGGWAIAPEDAQSLQDTIKEIYRLWLQGTLGDVRAQADVLRQFDRRALTGSLAAIFNELAAHG